MPTISSLWRAPSVNPVTLKARSIPAFNPLNVYGRVFSISWFAFFIAFWSWYAFPPLLTTTIRQDLHLSQTDIANSNIVSMLATLLVRLFAGPACDRFGPRWTFIVILLLGAVPTALAGTATTPGGLITVRFFVGILGGSFIPCQVYTTSFFDKNIVGTATSLTAGLGNAGGGVTFWVMPAILDSLVSRQGMTDRVAWRVAFVIPFILITFTALFMALTCPDCPTGSWSARSRELRLHHEMRDAFIPTLRNPKSYDLTTILTGDSSHDAKKLGSSRNHNNCNHLHITVHDAPTQEDDILAAASWELVEKPTYHRSVKAIASLPTIALVVAYFCSLGTELSVNSILGAYYFDKFPSLGQTGSGNWAAVFGVLNAIFRPAGGMFSDIIYSSTKSLWSKKVLVHVFGVTTGVFLLLIGFINPQSKAIMFGLITGLAFFVEAGNGGNFSLVPHVHPSSIGLITGVTGAGGDLGGLIFLLIFRSSDANYGRGFWIIGIVTIGLNLSVSWIRPIPHGQLGGR